MRDPGGGEAEELVPGGVAERVVDVLEVIEVEEEDGEGPGRARAGAMVAKVSTAEAGEGLFELVDELGAVRQAGEGVVVGHVVDVGFGVAPGSDVVVAGDPAAGAGGFVVDRKDAAVAQGDFGVDDAVVVEDPLAPGGILARGHVGAGAGGVAEVDDLAEGHAEDDLARIDAVELGVLAVEQEEAMRFIEHTDALLDVVEGEIAQFDRNTGLIVPDGGSEGETSERSGAGEARACHLHSIETDLRVIDLF